MTLGDLLQSHKKELLKVAAKHGAINIRIFGSVARGDSKEASDIDFLVRMEKGRSLLDLVALWQDFEGLLGKKIDIVTEGGMSPYLKDKINKEAVPL